MAEDEQSSVIADESLLSDADILAREEYKSAVVSKRIAESAVGRFFGGLASGFWNSRPIQAIRRSPVGRVTGWVTGKINAALNHPVGKLATFGLGVGLSVAAVVGSGGTALIIPAAALCVTVGAKVVSAGFKAHHENKMHSLEHQLKLLRILKKKVVDHEHKISEIKSRAHGSQHGLVDSHRTVISQVDTNRAVRSDDKVHTRNLPTLSNEIAKSVASNALYVAGAAIDASALPRTAADLGQRIHAAHSTAGSVHSAGDFITEGADIREGTIGVGMETREQFEGADREAVLKARINILSRQLGVPPCRNTSELTSYVRGKMSSLRAEERLINEHVSSGLKSATEENIGKKFTTYKSEAENNLLYDIELRDQLKRASYAKRMAIRIGESLVGSKEEWLGRAAQEPVPPSTPVSTHQPSSRNSGQSV